MLRTKIEAWASAVVAALLGAGVLAAFTTHTIHSKRPAAAAAVAPAGHRAQDLIDEHDGLTVSVPAGWQSATLAPGSHTDMVEAFAAEHPQFKSLVAQRVTRAATTVGLLAIDPRSHTTIVIQSAPAAPETVAAASSAGVLPLQLIDQYEKLGVQVFHTGTVHLPFGPVLEAEVGLVVGGQELLASQYFFADGNQVVTITIEGPDTAANRAVHDRIAHSARRTR